jgi:hypothetical protein
LVRRETASVDKSPFVVGSGSCWSALMSKPPRYDWSRHAPPRRPLTATTPHRNVDLVHSLARSRAHLTHCALPPPKFQPISLRSLAGLSPYRLLDLRSQCCLSVVHHRISAVSRCRKSLNERRRNRHLNQNPVHR